MKALNLVHLNGLRAVEAVGRLGSLKAAAAELGVTLGAVSQQVQKAESQLGRELFVRSPRGLVANPLGVEVIAHLTAGMRELTVAVTMASAPRHNVLNVSVAPVLAAKWLVWRLNKFNELHPHIRIRVDATTTLVDPNTSDIDVCIRVFTGPPPGVKASKLIEQRVFPVCSPAVAGRIGATGDIRHIPIIRDVGGSFPWSLWLEPLGLTEADLTEGPSFSDGSLCLDAAIAGQGIFLAWETLASDALERGQVIAPLEGRLETGTSYWFIEKDNPAKPRETRAFEAWLRDALQASFAAT
jgi:DNA-binding transcriptional LysR family regulator